MVGEGKVIKEVEVKPEKKNLRAKGKCNMAEK
jgi:hypothetical protein